jgi:FkbM family methyltransferase
MSLFNTLKFISSHPLNRGRRLMSLLQFAKWQAGSRIVPGAVVFDWVNGSKFLVKPGETGLTGNIYTGLHEFADMAFLLHVLREDDLFIDVGANVGSYSILACAAIGARGYAFEPVPQTHSRLVDNLRLNHIEERVKHPNIGIGDEAGSLIFTADGDTVNHALAAGESSQNTVNVEMATLDSILADESPSLIKIDVEGFETPALKGAEMTLSKDSLHSVIMELNGSGDRYGFDEMLIMEMMFDHGFATYSYDPMQRTLINLAGKNLVSGNTLFIKNRDYVLARLEGAPKVLVNGVLL